MVLNQRFAVVSDTEFMLRIIVVTFIDRVSEKNNGWIKSYGTKSVIFVHFGAFLSLKVGRDVRTQILVALPKRCYRL